MNGLDSVPIALQSRTEGGAEWIHLLPAGAFNGRDGRGPWRLRDASAVIEASLAHAGRRLIPVDYDHQIDLASPFGGIAPAAGWIETLQPRMDGIWGKVQWTERAAGHLASREYRYLSPVFTHNKSGDVTCLLRAGLTNNPNLDQLVALAHREHTVDVTTELRGLLDMPDNADDAAIVAKVRELLTSRNAARTPDPVQFVPMRDFERAVAEVNRLNQGLSLQAAREHVTAEITAGRLMPFLKEWAIQLCNTNKPAFDEFVRRTGKNLQQVLGPLNVNWGGRPSPDNGGLTAEESAVASTLGIAAKDFLSTKTARNSAREHNR